jgi:hypothetical protein
MKILLTNNYSLLEFLYRRSTDNTVELTMNMADADIVVGTKFNSNFYDKTIVIPSLNSYDREDLIRLSEVNVVLSRLPLADIVIDYTLEPFEKIELKNLIINSKKNRPISDLSIKDFLVTKYKDDYYINAASTYLGTKYKGNLTLVGLLKHQKQTQEKDYIKT